MSAKSVTDAYVKHALQLIRVSNGLQADSNAIMRMLGQKLKKLLAGENIADMGVGALRRLIADADKLIYSSLDKIGGAQSSAVSRLVATEAKWAVKIGKYETATTDAAIARAIGNFTVVGNTIDDRIAALGQTLSNAVESQIRLGAVAGQTDKEIIERIIGPGRGAVGGIMESSRRGLRGMVDAATQGAADTGRRLSMAANGINAMQWSAKLDEKVCPSCGERDGKIWLIDGTPVGHDIIWMPAPLHPWCRCLAMPLDIPQDALDDVEQDPGDSFGDWLGQLDDSEQNNILGEGRADLWRSGDITTADLIGQNGLAISLNELEASVENV